MHSPDPDVSFSIRLRPAQMEGAHRPQSGMREGTTPHRFQVNYPLLPEFRFRFSFLIPHVQLERAKIVARNIKNSRLEMIIGILTLWVDNSLHAEPVHRANQQPWSPRSSYGAAVDVY